MVILICSGLANVNSQENLCYNQPDGSLIPDPNHQNLYYSCLNERATLIVCDGRMVFSVAEQQCVREILDELQVITTVADDSSVTDTTKDLPDDNTVFTTQSHISTTETLDTDAETTVSITSTAIFTITSPTIAPTTTDMSNNLVVTSFCPCRDTYEPTYLSSYEFCDQYFMCYHGRPLEMSCCRGHHWHPALKRCVPEYESLCEVSIYADPTIYINYTPNS